MPGTTKQVNIRDARTPEQALTIARARISDLSDEYAQKADAAAVEGDMQMHESHAENTTGLEKAWMLLGDLLRELNEHELNEQGRQPPYQPNPSEPMNDTTAQGTAQDTPQGPEPDRYEYYRDTTTDGCVIAIDPDLTRPDELHEGYAGTFDRANSPVLWEAVAPKVLGERLTVEEAKEIHPRLFERMEADRVRNQRAEASAHDPTGREWIQVGTDPLRYEYGRTGATHGRPTDVLAYVEREPSGYFRWAVYRGNQEAKAAPSRAEAQERALATLRERDVL
mgnify:CR=1 FL=1